MSLRGGFHRGESPMESGETYSDVPVLRVEGCHFIDAHVEGLRLPIIVDGAGKARVPIKPILLSLGIPCHKRTALIRGLRRNPRLQYKLQMIWLGHEPMLTLRLSYLDEWLDTIDLGFYSGKKSGEILQNYRHGVLRRQLTEISETWRKHWKSLR